MQSRAFILLGLLSIGAVGAGALFIMRGDLFATWRGSSTPPLSAPTNHSSREERPLIPIGDRDRANAPVRAPGQPSASAPTMPLRAVAEKPTQTPLQMYMQHIERAKAGDAKSQYRVAQSLQMCRTAPKSAERLNASIESGQLSDEQISEIRRRYKACEGFAALVPDMDAEITKWLRMSAEGGEPLAKSWDALLSYPNFDVDELKVLVREALRTGEPEAYSHVVTYYANVTPNDNADLYEAWLLISCEFEAGCDVARERDRVEHQYRLHEVLQIASIESSLREKLKTKNWDELGF